MPLPLVHRHPLNHPHSPLYAQASKGRLQTLNEHPSNHPRSPLYAQSSKSRIQTLNEPGVPATRPLDAVPACPIYMEDVAASERSRERCVRVALARSCTTLSECMDQESSGTLATIYRSFLNALSATYLRRSLLQVL
jgi:hypothetical protein